MSQESNPSIATPQIVTRRSIALGALAAAALAVPAAVSAAIEPDPIYAAIDVHRSALAAWTKALKHQSGIPVGKEHPPQAQIHLYDMRIDDASDGEIESVYASYPEEIVFR
jgi:hypothetical protein